MNIIVVGAGKIGSALAEGLVNEGHEVTIVDQNDEVLKTIAQKLDIIGVQGNGAVLDVLYEAGIRQAEVLIAATESDEVNILCCILAGRISRVTTIARVRNPEYEDQMEFYRDELKISMIINPEKLAAKSLVKLFRFPSAISFESFGSGRVDMIKIRVAKDSPLCDVSMRDFRKKFAGSGVLVCVIEREKEVIIPSGSVRILANDMVSFVAKPSDAVAFCKECNVKNDPIRSVFMIGGGRISWFIADALKNDHRGIELKVIEKNTEKAEALAEAFPKLTVINADGTSQQLMTEEGIDKTDAVVSLTGNDEVNIVIGLVAGQLSKARTFVKVNRVSAASVLRELPVSSVMSPREVVRDEVVRYVRALENSKDMDIEALHTLAYGRVEALEFVVTNDERLVSIPLTDLPLKSNILVASIIRNGKALMPGGSDTLEEGDHVIVITTHKGFRTLSDILS